MRKLLILPILIVLAAIGPLRAEAQESLWDFELPAGVYSIELGGQHFEFELTHTIRVQIFELTPAYIAGALTLVDEPEGHARIRWEEQDTNILNTVVVGYRRFVWAESGHPELQDGNPDTERSPKGKSEGDDAGDSGTHDQGDRGHSDDKGGGKDEGKNASGNDSTSTRDDSTSTRNPEE